jgi:Ni,Fe-hydrogenase I cytochrome b subunit
MYGGVPSPPLERFAAGAAAKRAMTAVRLGSKLVDRVRAAMARVPLDRVAYGIGVALAALVVLGGLLIILEANRDNAIVSFFTDIGEFLAAPFDDMFRLDSRDGRIALNWGIGAFVYFILGVVVAGLIGRFARRGSAE